ncbi:zinc finger CW-type PWWP domain protein 1-like isoform X6 [Bolinopsis microptera]|uniref:zinc finger CW-type PWWP domain protein 1-like isoform X6 n=1 Tax=Bolinopsis microptera TaxID=2820187 RepID=UPI00307A8E33
MASAVDEVSSALGLSQSSNPGDDLKSPEQHQASMFAARQQLQAKHKDSSSFPTTSSGTKKVAAIKPQFKPLSKKQSSFVTPYIKKEDPIKENPQKLSPQKKPIVKQLDKLREPSPGDTGRQLPTVSSRYHSPSLKRSRGRHNDETIVSDEEIQKAKMIKKSFTSPERKTFSPKPSPKNSPKLSPKMCSPKSRTAAVNSSDEVDRQKVNDFFSNKFGLSFSTPKGADRPKPLLKFARKDESSDADYSTVQSPGKFKSTFRALGNDKVEGKEPDKKKKAAEEKKPVRKAEPMQKQSRKVEQKTKRKIERSPKRPRKEEPKKSLSMSASSSSSSSSSEDSDSDSCMKRSANSSAKSTTKQRENKPTQKKQPPPQKNAKEQKLKIKEETMKAELIRKRKKVYSSSNSSESENDEFTLSCTNSDNLESIWVQCERCSKWRYLRDTSDPNLIPDDWVCTLNPDKKYNNCNAPEESWTQLDQGYEFVYSAYSLGSLVWGKMQGYPWWPGMIDNDPLTRTFYYKHANSQLPDKYHVTFFGIQATRAWIGKKFIKVYNPDDKEDQLKYDQRKSGKGMREAIAMANQAFHLELNDRKKIYGFKEQGKSVEVVPLDNTSKAKATKDRKVVTKTVSAIKKLKPSYVSRLYEKAVLKLSQESQSTHTFHDNHPGGGRGRGRPRKTSAATEKPAKRKKITKRSSDEQSYIATPSRLNSLDVIENIENEINQVLRDCSPSPTGFDH